MSAYAGPSFVRIIGNDSVEVFVTGRDNENVSRVGVVTARLVGEEFEIDGISENPVLDIGPPGTFDENGVSYPWLLSMGSRTFMYYVGWVAGGRTRFQNYTGLAVSEDGGKTFSRFSNVPILDRTTDEPFGSGSCAVFEDPSVGFRMFYTSFDSWITAGTTTKPCYKVREAVSDDGMLWRRTGRAVLDFEAPEEHIIGKPVVLMDTGMTHMWYSFRGESYRIGYATSADGLNFKRRDSEVGIDVSSDGWDSEMIEYAFVFDHQSNRYMIYNGNDFGRTGLGLAIQVDHSRSEV